MADKVDLSPEDLHQLIEARTRAAGLLADLEGRQADLDANPPELPSEKLALGRAAMQKAIDAARRTVESLDSALALAGVHLQ